MSQAQIDPSKTAVLTYGPPVASALTALVLRVHGLRDPEAVDMLLTMPAKELWQRAVRAHSSKPEAFASLSEKVLGTLTDEEKRGIRIGLILQLDALPALTATH